MNPALLIPIYDHPHTIADVVAGLADYGLPLIVVDDGSHAETRAVLETLARRHDFVEVRRIPHAGKGAALKVGYRRAAERGFSHVVQLDADGQHAPSEVGRFLAAIERNPQALILAAPDFGADAPAIRIAARQLSRGLVWLATRSFRVGDPLVGLRGVPLAPVIALIDRMTTGDHMEFDPEVVVRLYWDGVPIENLRTPVRYPPDGVSHFDVVPDYARLTWLYTRLVAGMLVHGAHPARAPAGPPATLDEPR